MFPTPRDDLGDDRASASPLPRRAETGTLDGGSEPGESFLFQDREERSALGFGQLPHPRRGDSPLFIDSEVRELRKPIRLLRDQLRIGHESQLDDVVPVALSISATGDRSPPVTLEALIDPRKPPFQWIVPMLNRADIGELR